MLKNFVKSLDKEGWALVVTAFIEVGLTLLGIQFLMTPLLHPFMVALSWIIYVGLAIYVAFKLIDEAIIGSIYRNRYGKNRELYLAKKSYLDKRFLTNSMK